MKFIKQTMSIGKEKIIPTTTINATQPFARRLLGFTGT